MHYGQPLIQQARFARTEVKYWLHDIELVTLKSVVDSLMRNCPLYMNEQELNKLGSTLWGIADDLRGAMNADDFRDYMLSFLFLRYLSDNYEASAKKELGADYYQQDMK